MKTNDESRDKVSTLDGGWDRLARDFRHAVSNPVLIPRTQALLIYQAQLMSWTRAQLERSPDPYPFSLNLSEIAKEYGMARSGLHKEHRRLVARKIFLDLGDGRFLINKDYRTWIADDGSQLLPDAFIRSCRRFRRKARLVHSSGQRSSTPVDNARPLQWTNDCSVVSTPVVATEVRRDHSSGHNGKSVSTTPVDNFRALHIEERAHAGSGAHAELNSNTERVREREEPLIPSLSPKCAPSAERDRGDGSGPRSEADEAIAWVVERIGVAFPGDESIAELMPMWVRSWVAEGCTLIEIQDAVIKALAKVRRASGLVGYIKGCLDTRRQSPPQARADAGPTDPTPSKAQAKRQALEDGFDEWARQRAARKETADGS